VRPGVKSAILIGKYLNGVYWTATAGLVGLFGAMLIANQMVAEPIRLFFTLALLVLGASLGYGSVFALIGAVFPRRAMMICVVYIMIFEVLMSNVPAIINELTVQHRLLNILLRTMDWNLTSGMPSLIDENPVWWHLTALGCYVLVNLVAAALVLRWREYATSEQNQ
jgi:hypothetical protein